VLIMKVVPNFPDLLQEFFSEFPKVFSYFLWPKVHLCVYGIERKKSGFLLWKREKEIYQPLPSLSQSLMHAPLCDSWKPLPPSGVILPLMWLCPGPSFNAILPTPRLVLPRLPTCSIVIGSFNSTQHNPG
jgi:hypothetical protein